MADKNSHKDESNLEEKLSSRIRLHLTITRAQPLLLEEADSLEDGIRSTRIMSLANLGLLVERGFFSGEFFKALQDPSVQRALMTFKAENLLRGDMEAPDNESVRGSNTGIDRLRTDDTGHEKPVEPVSQSSENGRDSGELEPGSGVRVEQQRPRKTQRMK